MAREYIIRVGESEELDYLGILPPPSEQVINEIRNIMKMARIAIEGEGVKGDSKPYFEIRYQKRDEKDVLALGQFALSAIQIGGDQVNLDAEVLELNDGKELFSQSPSDIPDDLS